MTRASHLPFFTILRIFFLSNWINTQLLIHTFRERPLPSVSKNVKKFIRRSTSGLTTSWGHKTLKNLFGIEMTPSDTQMRSILDSSPTSLLHQSFKILIDFVRLKKRLKDFSFLSCQKFDSKPLYLMAVDATGFFSSSKIMCPSCLVKSKGTENERYHHQLLAATIVASRTQHPRIWVI